MEIREIPEMAVLEGLQERRIAKRGATNIRSDAEPMAAEEQTDRPDLTVTQGQE